MRSLKQGIFQIIAIVSISSAMLLILVAVCSVITKNIPAFITAYDSVHLHDFAGLLVNLAAGLFTLSGILFAVETGRRGWVFNALSKLLDEEATQEQAEAKQLLWEVDTSKNSSENIYTHVRNYLRRLSPKKRNDLEKARRKLTSFWYRAARLVELGFLDSTEIFESVGPPELIKILEPLEAIKAETIDPAWKPRSWPPMKLLIIWLKNHNQPDLSEQARVLKPQVPARPELYLASKTTTTKKKS